MDLMNKTDESLGVITEIDGSSIRTRRGPIPGKEIEFVYVLTSATAKGHIKLDTEANEKRSL